jgi:hypothetical protein
MANSGIEDRGRALEEAFFKKQHAAQLEKLRRKQEHEEARRALVEASGIDDADLIDRLVSIGIHAETLAALTLIPLVEVAWADGHVDERERKAILKGAESSKIEPGSPSHELLLIWTQDRPAPDLMASWNDYIRALCAELSAEQKQHLEERIVGRARAVAEAAGGFLGLGSKVSAEEEDVLQQLQQAFRAGA